MKRWLVLASLLASPTACAADVRCVIGLTRCIESQGTNIHPSKAVEILDRCDDFTAGDIGARAMRLSFEEITRQGGGRLTPLVRAWHAYGD